MVQSIDDARRRRSESAGRVPPHNLDAESSLLGAMLLSKDAIASAIETCALDDFYKPAHGHIFEAITTLYGRGEPVDPVTVADELTRAGLLQAIGGAAVLTELQASTPATSNAGRYARIIEEHALLRRLIGVANEVAEMGYSLPDDVEQVIDQAESMMFQVAERRVADTLLPLSDLLSQHLDHLEHLYERGEAITGTPTGYHDLDELLAGLQPSALITVGARPGMGKTAFALGMAAHAAIEASKPVLFFSLEMGHNEITQRLLAAEAKVESTKLRTGRLADSDWSKISHAIGRLSASPLYIDDNPNLTVMEIRAKARRLQSRLGDLGLIIIDYLQLMSGRRTAENRQVEVSEMSRGLKILARELKVPVVALSQLSRNLETRADKRPVLADLRESGCLTADTRVLRADTNEEVSLGELLEAGARDIPVWSLDDNKRLVPAVMTHVFPSGVKETFELRLASGRRVKASANHPFLRLDGWRRLDELAPGDRLSVPRRIPAPEFCDRWSDPEVVMLAHLIGDGCVAGRQPVHYTSKDPANIDAVRRAAAHWGITPRDVQRGSWSHLYLPAPYPLARGRRNPIQEWLGRFGLDGKRSHEKFVPGEVASLPLDQMTLFLKHLWATDGCLWTNGRTVSIYYATSSRRLADDVARLLLRFGIQSRIKSARKGGYRPMWNVWIYGAANQRRFLHEIGAHGAKAITAQECEAVLADRATNTNVDTVPTEIWDDVRDRMADAGVTGRALAAGLGMAYCGSAMYRHAPSRERLGRVAELLDDKELAQLATSDVFWDAVVEIVPLGPQPVFDATVLGTHNFVADGVIVHNSIEQDSDVVMFIYRDEVYHAESPDRGSAEIIVSKHRNGPTGITQLAFLDRYTRFANMAKV